MKTRILVLSLSFLWVACGDGNSSRMRISNKGSDTLVNVAQAWAEKYRDKNADVVVWVSGGGSGTGISALIDGTVDIANASREMKQKEIDHARKNGIEPAKHIVGFDALAVYVHKDNPVESMTLAQLADIYGEGGKSTEWNHLGLAVPGCGSDEIVRVSRQNNSGTFAYFRKATGLSLKQQQKLCIARLLPVNPSVLLMDEPCPALDPAATSAVEELIWELRGRYSILIVTHNMAQARRASEECIFMLLGKVIEHTRTKEMFVTPARRETADYIEGRYG